MSSEIASYGWELASAEARNAAHPNTFHIPSREKRETLVPGDGAQLLFDTEIKEQGRIVDRGIHRMWVIVKARIDSGYVGVLDNDPGAGENVHLREGDVITFGPEHVIATNTPPREYVIQKYGSAFFGE